MSLLYLIEKFRSRYFSSQINILIPSIIFFLEYLRDSFGVNRVEQSAIYWSPVRGILR